MWSTGAGREAILARQGHGDQVSLRLTGRRKVSTGQADRPSPALEVVGGVVRELNEIVRSGMVDLHVALGRAVIDRLYGGDLRAWRARGPRDVSFRQLAARTDKDLMVSATVLYRAVALCELLDRIGVSSWKHLGVSHMRGVLGLPDPDQRRLLVAAETERWTVERLEAESHRLRTSAERPRGRRRLPEFVKTVRRVAKLLGETQRTLGGPDQLHGVSDQEVDALRDTLTLVRDQLQILEAHLDNQLKKR